MTYDTNRYPINRGEHGDLGIKNNIQSVLTALLEYVCSQNGKVLTVRFDVRYPVDYFSSGDNRDISRMMAKLVQYYKRDGLNPHYAWVRERNFSHNPHYHCVLFLNGNKMRHYNHVFENAERYWQLTIGSFQGGLIHRCNDHPNGILIERYKIQEFVKKFAAVHYQLSYLAKEADKSEPKDGYRDFGVSRLHYSI